MTPLGMAASIGTAGVVKVLLEAGADLNARDEDGETPLHTAETAGVVKVLLEAGADPNPRCILRRWVSA